jgi:hypothetical protein
MRATAMMTLMMVFRVAMREHCAPHNWGNGTFATGATNHFNIGLNGRLSVSS